VVRRVRVGRKALFELEPQPIEEVRNYLDRVSKQWNDALSRLKSLLEEWNSRPRLAPPPESEGKLTPQC
jgi:hypothetical protein